MKKRSTNLLHLLLAVMLATPLASQAEMPSVMVQTPLGNIEGLEDTENGTTTFKGIRYATADRFELPIPTEGWSGTTAAKAFGSNCPQAARYNLTEQSLNENCLFLNVTVPAGTEPNAKLPVMVWIPGGGFVGGGSSLYDASRLAREGNLVVVTLNYRVGLFGFMPHPAMDRASNGTLGLEDQRMAMRWVKDNIAAFGGNPENITIAGESAGTGSICQHLASPENVDGLFQKAILISGACLQPLQTLEQALANATWEAVSQNPKDPNRRVHCPVPGDRDYSDSASLDCLKAASVSDLLQAQTFEAGNNLIAFLPVTDNQTVPRSFKQALASDQIMKVPMVIGGAKNELRLYVAYDVLGDNATQTKYPVNLQNVLQYYLPAYYGTDNALHRQIIERYFGSETATKNSVPKNLDGATLGSMLSDFNPTIGLNNCLYLQTSNMLNGVTGMPAIYQFEFDDPNALVLGVGIAPGKDPGFALGAVHSAILNYLFPNYSNTAEINAPDLPRPSDKLASQIIQYLANFMHQGAPSASALPNWPRYDGTTESPASDKVMLFTPGQLATYKPYGDLGPDSRQGHQCAFWESLFPQ